MSTASQPPPHSPRPSDDDDRPVLPSRSDDDSDLGWGDDHGERDADWYERERPPHHE